MPRKAPEKHSVNGGYEKENYNNYDWFPGLLMMMRKKRRRRRKENGKGG